MVVSSPWWVGVVEPSPFTLPAWPTQSERQHSDHLDNLMGKVMQINNNVKSNYVKL